MFVLRRITSDGRINNQCIGEEYAVFKRGDSNDDFARLAERIHPDYTSSEEIFAVLVAKEGMLLIPLYRKSKYYIMSDNGNTFEAIKL